MAYFIGFVRLEAYDNDQHNKYIKYRLLKNINMKKIVGAATRKPVIANTCNNITVMKIYGQPWLFTD